jgi:cyclophilin family peptidyl-prolyl cis-trans isomerase
MRSTLRTALSIAFAASLLAPVACLAGSQTQGVKAKSGGTNPVVLMETSKGDIKIELDKRRAPITVENFLNYVDQKFYDGLIFHRVINGFMIQGGGFSQDMEQKPPMAPIKLESQNGLQNKRGTIAMARTNVPDSATAQFFINVADNMRSLDYKKSGTPNGYAVFGKVIEGMDVVDAIKAVETKKVGRHGDVPTTAVIIKSVRLINAE